MVAEYTGVVLTEQHADLVKQMASGGGAGREGAGSFERVF